MCDCVPGSRTKRPTQPWVGNVARFRSQTHHFCFAAKELLLFLIRQIYQVLITQNKLVDRIPDIGHPSVQSLDCVSRTRDKPEFLRGTIAAHGHSLSVGVVAFIAIVVSADVAHFETVHELTEFLEQTSIKFLAPQIV